MVVTQRDVRDFFPNPWVFLQNELGYTTLAVRAPGGLMPVFVFESDESLRAFYLSTKKAYEGFVPLPVRQGLEIADEFNGVEQEN